jgi:CrcB protein
VPLLIAIAVGGVVGSLGRFGIAEVLGPWTGDGWPWATLLANLVGALIIGIVASSRAVAERAAWVRPFLITGVLGGFTTFSALALETGVLLDSGRVATAISYVLATMIIGVLAVQAGAAVARRTR